MTTLPPPGTAPPTITLVIDRHDAAAYTHTALAAHAPAAGRITLHPGPGTTTASALAHDLIAALGKPPLLPGRFPGGRQPAWQAATAWIHALPATRLTVLRAHRLTARQLEHLLHLREAAGLHLTLVCHRPRIPAALHQALTSAAHTSISDLEQARCHYGPPSSPCPSQPPEGRPRWITLPSLDRLISYDSPTPCTGSCTPPPAHLTHRPAPRPLTPATAAAVTRRLHAATAHPRLAAALATALFTRASLQQLATARQQDFNNTTATLALHDRLHYTDGCATHPVPPWARVFLRAAAGFTRLAPAEDSLLLAGPRDRAHLLGVAEAAKLRPPQPPAGKRLAPRGCIEWDWHERQQAERYNTLLQSSRRARGPSAYAPR